MSDASSKLADHAFAEIEFDGRPIRLEYAWINPTRRARPLLVFLHEGLGSLQMWRDYPQTLCDAIGCRGLVYSRFGFGCSTPRPVGSVQWAADYHQRQACEILPRLLSAIGVGDEKLWLFGHSDGATMALLHAALRPDRTAGVIALSPHVFVEQVTLDGITVAKQRYQDAGLRARLGRYHLDVDDVLRGWTETWLDPAFRDWSIEALMQNIRCPVLLIQGEQDDYGSADQLRAIQRQAPQSEILELADCGHIPYREQPAAVTAAVVAFLKAQGISPALSDSN